MTELSYAHGPSSTALLSETIGSCLTRIAAAHPDREAVVSCAQGVRLTYAELDEAVDRLACGLLTHGIEAGDRVGVWGPNRIEWLLVQYATAKVGAILVNVNPAYRTHELTFALDQSGVRLLFSAADFKTSDYRAMVDEVAGELPGLEDVVFFEDVAWNALAATPVGGEALAERMASLDRDDRINIQYTSGTTGFPKGATLTHHNILNNGFFVGELCSYTEQDRICVPVPFYHCFGMVMGNLAALTHGACVVIPAAGFDPAATLAAVTAERCTSLYGVPTMFIAMLGDPAFADCDFSTLRTGIMAGSPCPAEVMKRVVGEMNMAEVSICYGMTETSPVSTQTRKDDPLELRVGSIGRVGPHIEIKVIDPLSGLTVPRGETGELCTRGYSVMLGYWNEPEKTAEAKDAAGWMHTGDLATMDAAGYLNIVGRSKDMVIRGGENVYPREIEEFLYTHPDIADAQVVGVPDEKYGEELCVWIQLRDGAAAIDAAALREFCSGKLAHYKIPRYVHTVDEFPMTVTGKVRKNDMREQSIELLDLHDAAAAKTA
ncbi:3-[(3aS,4S,7aS)-7a-methyl-1,5-dioxo-octahydro-1H-inden-4-yl]propanoyl:CoA ligase [Paraconexibacter sp. AEG42_29]|uniref:3-[(3aS,4S,7aS)-7a-methyl-1, 5-dioxo-octahydro-1H-inden-4-yl]propanoyl:CoA ligase n=1 Tax=Paraconexibacter sp. AEG42_29 TaxID=2997339 RepID=A0AAU7AR36_9ACTN